MLEYAGKDPVRLVKTALAAAVAGRGGLAKRIWARLGWGWGQGSEAVLHLKVAEVLIRAGEDLEGGFDLSRVHPVLWKALEHLKYALKLDPALGEGWEEMGRILLNRGAATEAYFCLERAARLGRDVDELLAVAAREGYV